MRVIHKLLLNMGTHNYKMQADSKILTVQIQNGYICLWYDRPVAPTHMMHKRIMVIGTGHEFEDVKYNYVGTVQDQQFVWHVLELLT